MQLWTWAAKVIALQTAITPQGEWVGSQTAKTGVQCLWVANSVLCELLTALPMAGYEATCLLQGSCLCAPPCFSQKQAISLLRRALSEAQAAPGVLLPGQLCACHCCMLCPLRTSPCPACAGGPQHFPRPDRCQEARCTPEVIARTKPLSQAYINSISAPLASCQYQYPDPAPDVCYGQVVLTVKPAHTTSVAD